jgi:LmbE family N-acetylglucosaminyl deacetylase
MPAAGATATSMPPRTLVFVHAHPDDEALLTAGTMARAVEEGHRVVLVLGTDGAAGLTSGEYAHALADTRARELAASAAALGIDRVVHLGYSDSGLHGEVPDGFAHVGRFTVARRIAEVCDEEQADVLIGYDPSGGYGHPDHVQVHRAARTAVALCARPPRLFEATLPREPIARAVALAARLHLTPAEFDPAEFARAWTPRAQITHRVDVRRQLPAKDAALRAHASQASADGTTRTLGVLTQLPRALQALLLGTEYYVAVPDAHRRSVSSTSVGLS